ncbi:MAG: isoprenyl transferase [Halothermotrichaceae bacterium]
MNVPSHVAIIMDGNGRWAQERNLPRRKGHQEGVKTLKKITKKAGQMGIKSLTVYAFSTENWKRPGREVKFLLSLFKKTLITQAQDLFKNDVRVKIIGRRKSLPDDLIDVIKSIENKTKPNNGLMLNIAFNYGGRAEICDMVKNYLQNSNQKNNIKKINEEQLEKYLYNPYLKDIELLIRTGGEKRLSNFLLWQCAYAELYFIDKYWPEFSTRDFERSINVFQQRNRKFGGLKEMGE